MLSRRLGNRDNSTFTLCKLCNHFAFTASLVFFFFFQTDSEILKPWLRILIYSFQLILIWCCHLVLKIDFSHFFPNCQILGSRLFPGDFTASLCGVHPLPPPRLPTLHVGELLLLISPHK